MNEKNTLVIGDFHFGTKTNSVQWLEEMENYFVEIESLIEEVGVQKVIFLGDLFDVRYSINTLVGIKVKEIDMKTPSGEYVVNIAKGYYIIRIGETVRKIAIR